MLYIWLLNFLKEMELRVEEKNVFFLEDFVNIYFEQSFFFQGFLNFSGNIGKYRMILLIIGELVENKLIDLIN